MKPKLTKKDAEDIAELKNNGVEVIDILKEYGVSETTYRITMKKCGFDYLLKKPKLTNELIKKICEFRKKPNGVTDISRKYEIARNTARRALDIGIEQGLLSEEQDKNIEKIINSSTFKRKAKKYGDKRARQICSDAWYKGIGNNHNALVEAGRNRGKKTQQTSPHVKENLENRIPYGQYDKPVYRNIEFHSYGELKVVLTFLYLKLIKGIRVGKNYHVDVGRKIPDLLIDGKIFEYHPPAEGIYRDNYKEKRIPELRENGFNGPIYIIEKQGDLYKSLKDAKYKISIREYSNIIKKVNKKIEKMKKLREDLKGIPF